MSHTISRKRWHLYKIHGCWYVWSYSLNLRIGPTATIKELKILYDNWIANGKPITTRWVNGR